MHTLSLRHPMVLFAGLMAAMALVSIGGLLFDDRILLGAPIWLKPFKFSVSIAAYCLTWAWLTSMLTVGKRLAAWVSNTVIVLLAIEMIVITAQVVRGRASHFNVATPLESTLWQVMGTSIVIAWLGTAVLTVLVFRSRIADAASRVAVRLGAVISLIGIGLGALMTTPTAKQLHEGVKDFAGAHSVGVDDGGPGMPITGWSTIGGDLRIPHFVGMHALQALPLFLLLLGVLARWFPRLRAERVRARLVLIAGLGYAGVVALVTWQAERGQSLIHPDSLTLGVFAALVVAVGSASAFALRSAHAVAVPA